eukprot:7702397-Pyramimonas_sp.AAC.1
MIKKDVAAGRAGRVAVFDVERSPRKSLAGFTGKLMYDRLPSFRTGGPMIFFASAHGIHEPIDK